MASSKFFAMFAFFSLVTLAVHAVEESESNLNGLFGTIISPFRNGLNQIKRLMGAEAEEVSEDLGEAGMKAFKAFMQLYNKTYSEEELPRRLERFIEQSKIIEQSIKDFLEGHLSFKMSQNPFLDWFEDELKALMGVKLPDSLNRFLPEEIRMLSRSTSEVRTNMANSRVERDVSEASFDDLNVRAEQLPASMDWRTSGCIAAPMDQQTCGCCYAIASVSVVEAMRCIKKVSGPVLSSQQVVDCSIAYDNHGCDGGWPTSVYKYLQDEGDLARERCYNFAARQGVCKMYWMEMLPGCTVDSSPTDSRLNYKVLTNERDIQRYVAENGPVATVLQASNKFLYYGSGIFDDPTCSRSPDAVDHAIVIVGYGREAGTDYWLIKNSWGTSWGDEGYAKVKRGTNACSIGHFGWAVTS